VENMQAASDLFIRHSCVTNVLLNRATAADKYIYLLQEVCKYAPTGFYKVGSTTNIEKRVSDLQTGNPRCLNIFASSSDKVSQSVEGEVRTFMLNKDRYQASKSVCGEGGGTMWLYTKENGSVVKKDFKDGLDACI
jgi:hypothetical protein